MWISFFFKEWLKIRLVFFVSLVAVIASLVIVYSQVNSDMISVSANEYMRRILFERHIFYSLLKYIPLVSGVMTGVSQFLPERVDNRIKLTLHLPLKEEVMGLVMILFGALALITVYAVMAGMFLLAGSFFFPKEILVVSLLTIMPWCIAGFGAYFLTALVIFEPLVRCRITYAIIGCVFTSVFFLHWRAGAYIHAIFPLTILVAVSSISVLFALLRYRKGVM